jgi:hypothetical protein
MSQDDKVIPVYQTTAKALEAYKKAARADGISTRKVSGWAGLANACGWNSTGIKKSAKNAREFLLTRFPNIAVAPGRAANGTATRKAERKAEKARRYTAGIDVNSDEFLFSFAWRKLRMEALKAHGARCQCCGATPADGMRMHVDHIKPRRRFPELALVLTNLQVLCEECNHGKGSWDETDWRPEADASEVLAQIARNP